MSSTAETKYLNTHKQLKLQFKGYHYEVSGKVSKQDIWMCVEGYKDP